MFGTVEKRRALYAFLANASARPKCNRFIELNETEIEYNVKTDKNNAPVQRTHRTLHGL